MGKKIFDLLLKLLSTITNKRVVYFSNAQDGLQVAIKSKYGFWYYGNILDQSDIAYGIASNGTVETFDTENVISILKKLKPDFTFYDIGSNTGWYTMIASTINTTNTVYSFEPIKEHIDFQKETVSLNKKESQVTIFEVALSDHNGMETIRLAGSGTSLDGGFLETDFGKRDVKVQTLDSITEEQKLNKPDFIKIDVEGHEYKLLTGAKKVLSESSPILFVEIIKTFNNIKYTNKDFEKNFNFLSSLGYIPFVLKDNAIKKFDPSMQVDGVYMYLFLSKEKHLRGLKLDSLISC